MRKQRTSKSAVINTCEPLVLMSASGVDSASDEFVSALENDVGDAEDTPSLLSRLRDAFSFSDANRRRSSANIDTVEREVQLVEPRLLLTADSLAATSVPANAVVENATTNEVDNRAPLFRYIQIQQDRAGVDGTGQADGHDPDGDVVSYSIVGGFDADRFEINSESGAISFRHHPSFSDPTADVDPRYHVIIRVSDGQLHHDQELFITEADSRKATHIVTPENLLTAGPQFDAFIELPIFNPPLQIPPDEEGTRSVQPYPDSEHFQSDTRNIIFRERPDFENPGDADGLNLYQILRGTEGVTVQVVDVENEGSNAPLLFDFEHNLTRRENGTLVTTFWEPFDPDGDSVELSIAGGADGHFFEISSGSDLLNFIEAPDFENPGDANGDNDYEVILRLSDGTLTQDYSVTVTVKDQILRRRAYATVPENSLGSIEIPEGEVVIDPIPSGNDGHLFEIGSDGRLRFKVAPDFEDPKDHGEDNRYQVTLKLMGIDGENYDWTVTVDVTNVLREANADGRVFSDALIFDNVPDTTFSTRPTFRWHQSEDVREYEIFVGRRGESEAIFRTRGFTENEFQLPNDIEPGEYTIWARVYHNDGTFSRWGNGHDITVGGRPQVAVNGNQITWNAIPGADRYEVWADHVDQFGNRITEKVISRTDVSDTSFAVTGEYADQNLTWWVRAINDRNGSTEHSGWSRPAYTQQPEFLQSPENVRIENWSPCSAPEIQLPDGGVIQCRGNYHVSFHGQPDATAFEIVVMSDDGETTLYRRTFEVGSNLGMFASVREIGLEDAGDVWIRALDSEGAKSRWVKITETRDVHLTPLSGQEN